MPPSGSSARTRVSLFAMSMVSLYFVGLSVWQAIYASTLDEASNRLITLVSIMSSVFTLVLALIEAMNDYRMKAHHMHACALAVNDLYHELQLMRPGRRRPRAGVPPPLQRGGAQLPLQPRARRLPDGAGRAQRAVGGAEPGRGCAMRSTSTRSTGSASSPRRWCWCCSVRTGRRRARSTPPGRSSPPPCR